MVFKKKINIKELLIPAILLGLLIFVHLVLISKTFVVDFEGNIRTAITGYGDIPLHMTQISKFAFTSFNLNEPIFAGTKLSYPFFINLISGIILRISNNFQFSTLTPVFILVILNIILTYEFFKKVLKSELFSTLATLTAFLGGGLGGFILLFHTLSNKDSVSFMMSQMVSKSMSTITKWDAKFPTQNIDFGSPISLVFLHQRPFFLGFFLFMIFMLSLLKIRQERGNKSVVAGGIVLGLMPLSHTHSFVAAIITLFALILTSFFYKEKIFVGKLLRTSIIGAIVAMPQLFYLLSDKTVLNSSSDFFSIRMGWMVSPTIGSVSFPVGKAPSVFSLSYLNFLIVNFGIVLPLFIFLLLVLVLKIRKNKKDLFFPVFLGLSGLLIFLCGQIIKFQPWDYDNNKIFVYFQIFAVSLIFFFLKNLKKSVLVKLVFTLLFLFTAIFSGLLDIYPRLAVSSTDLPVIFSNSSSKLSEFIKKNISEKDIIVTGTSHLNPVSSLCGRVVLVGYPGWLWTRGIKYNERLKDLSDFYKNPSMNSKIIKEFDPKYVLLDNQVVSDFGADQKIFNKRFIKVFQEGEYSLYAIR